MSKEVKDEVDYLENVDRSRSPPERLHPLLGDRDAERKIVRKLDIRLIPVAFIVYMITFIDRTNIGNARIAGLEEDLGLEGTQFNVCLLVLYVTYILVEAPSNFVLKLVGARLWLSFLVISFALVSMFTAFVQNFAGMVAVRMVLGLTEGGVCCGMALWLSRFYRKDELVLRIGLFVSSVSLAGAFGGLLAGGLLKIGSIGSIKGWRLIYLVEGWISIALGVLFYLLAVDEPSTAFFLSEDERALAVARMQQETVGIKHVNERANWKLVRRGIFNINTWLMTLGYGLTQVSVQGLSLFMPTIIRALMPAGSSTVETQLRTVPVYIASFTWSIAVAWISQRLNRRGYVMMASVPFAIAGYCIFRATTDSKARFGAAFLTACGIFPLGPFFLAWGANNTAPDSTRAVATAIIPGISSIGSIVATFSYLPSDAPNYPIGNSLNIATTTAAWLCALTGVLYNKWENRQRALGRRDHRLENATEEEIEQLGSKHPEFKMSI